MKSIDLHSDLKPHNLKACKHCLCHSKYTESAQLSNYALEMFNDESKK